MADRIEPAAAALQTRAQRDLIFAEERVGAVKSEKDAVQKIYGGLCLRFPIFVLTCGLCQALAFSAAKAAGDGERGRAHRLLLQHVGELLDAGSSPLTAVREANALTYRHQTRRVLAAWVYFKRFAVSILKAGERDAGEDS